MPYVSQKPGKTLYLLKSNSKVIAKGKKRKVVPLLGSIDEFKESKKKAVAQHEQQQQQERPPPMQMNIDSMLLPPSNMAPQPEEKGKKKMKENYLCDCLCT